MPDYSDSTNYPVFASKTLFLEAMHTEIEQGCNNCNKIVEIMQRVANTDTDNWTADSTEDGLITGDATVGD